ncbi:MAG: LysR family transcriptional regulator [Deltaproteobacteria bacterium]|nr:LysR family transcriptional regulator [Deltaproteobacteria bacterium]
MRVLCRIWLDKNGKAFGEGPYNLLKRIEETGSLSRAAKEMGISYKKAWQIINNCERRLGFKLLDKRAGGKKGGGSLVTEEGKNFMKSYEEFRDEIRDFVEKTFQKYFGKDNWSLKN